MKKISLVAIALIGMFHLYLYYKAQVVYLTSKSGRTERVFCLYTNKCSEIISNGGQGDYKVEKYGQMYFSNLFSDFEIVKNPVNPDCVDKKSQSVVRENKTLDTIKE